MKLATQIEIDIFIKDIFFDENIYPYLTTNKWTSDWKEFKNDWEGIYFTNNNLSYLCRISFDRGRGELEFNICLFAKNPISAGRCIQGIKYFINRYKPKAINSIVHASNIKSLKIHNKIYGNPWGIESLIGWDSRIGKHVDLHYFRKIL